MRLESVGSVPLPYIQDTVSSSFIMMQRSKCHKNFKMKRNPRKVRWTKAYRRLRGKDMTQFERKRNRLERYDRNVTENTLKVIKKISKIRHVRTEKHITEKFKNKKEKELREARTELEQRINLVKPPSLLKKVPSLTLPIKVKITPKQAQAHAQPMEE